MGFFNATSTPTEGKSFFGSYNIPVKAPEVTPTTTLPQKIGGVLKPIAQDIYQTAATIPVRAAQAEELLRTSFFGGPDSQKKAQEFATQPVNIGFGVQVKPLDTSSNKRAAQQTVGDILKVASFTPIGKGLTVAKQGALAAGVYGLGSGMSEGLSAKDIAKQTAASTIGGAVLGKTLSVLGGARAASQLAKKTEEQLYEEALKRANFGPIPEASAPKLSLPAPRTAAETPINLPEKGILEAQQRIREPYAPSIETKPKSPLHEEASKFNVRDDFVKSQIKKETQVEAAIPKQGQALRATKKPLNEFIKNETDFLVNTQQKVPKGYSEKLTKIWEAANKPLKVTEPPKTRAIELAKIWNEAKGISTETKTTNIPKSEPIPKTPALPFGRVPETRKIIGYKQNSYGEKRPIYEQTAPVTPEEFVAQAKAKKEGVPYVAPEPVPTKVPEVVTPETVTPTPVETPITPTQEGFQNISYAERTARLNQMDSQHIEDVVFNGATPEAGLPKEAYISHLYNQAENNPALAERLATSGVVTEAESKAGQNLGALAQAQGSVVNIIKDAHEALKQALPGYIKSGEGKALETIQSDIKTAFKKFNDTSLSVEERLSAIDILKCK